MTFDIRNYVSFPHNRSSGNAHIPCPNCQSSDTKNPALSINLETGAYHCFKCEGEKNGEIRKALGESKELPPSTLTNYVPQDVTVSPQVVLQQCHKLIHESRLANQWLLNRGFTVEMISRYKLGVKRVKRLDKMWWAISIPIPATDDGTQFYQKLRIAPWSEDVPNLPKWSQKGIPAKVWFTHLPDHAVQTYLCEGEWDAMLLGWMAKQNNSAIAVATFTCGCETVPKETELARLPGQVTIFYDRNDKPNKKTGERPGEKGAKKVAAALGSRGAIALVPQREEHAEVCGWDVSNAILAGFSWDDFVAAAAAAAIELPVERVASALENRSMSNSELMAKAPDYIDWLVPDLLTTDELFILAAPPRAGKTLLLMLLAKCVATGDKFLGRNCTQGTVLYVNLEDSPAKVKQRQLSQGWDTNVPVYWLDRFKLSETAYLREFVEKMDVRLVILDTLSRVRDDGFQEVSAEISKVLEPLQNMAQDLKVAVLLVHHTVKISIENAAKIDIFDTIRGSSSIRGVCRGSWVLAAGDRCHRLCVEHGHGESQDLEILLDPENLQWRAVRPWSPKPVTQVESILNYLQQVRCATISEIAAALNLNPNYVTNALWRLQSQDMIWKEAGKKNYPAIYYSLES